MERETYRMYGSRHSFEHVVPLTGRNNTYFDAFSLFVLARSAAASDVSKRGLGSRGKERPASLQVLEMFFVLLHLLQKSYHLPLVFLFERMGKMNWAAGHSYSAGGLTCSDMWAGRLNADYLPLGVTLLEAGKRQAFPMLQKG